MFLTTPYALLLKKLYNNPDCEPCFTDETRTAVSLLKQGYHDGSTFAVPMNEPDLPAVAYALEVTTDAAPPPRPWPDALSMSQALTR